MSGANNDYWRTLQSYQDVIGNKKSFYLAVKTKRGEEFRSSVLPLGVILDQVQAAIETMEEHRGLWLWTSTMHQLAFIPYDSIESVIISF